ncbi:hypothetical protein UY3_12075 [Chelonia mydas]|uniref:Uncharacterized protein n=1 Tax=Chelonia mydas TaxID=8469 RepID=M7B198_CHEMY|nr:hypothetical protein UY3_12075 [Chelonia mydas]
MRFGAPIGQERRTVATGSCDRLYLRMLREMTQYVNCKLKVYYCEFCCAVMLIEAELLTQGKERCIKNIAESHCAVKPSHTTNEENHSDFGQEYMTTLVLSTQDFLIEFPS